MSGARDYGVCATLLVGVQTKRLDKGAVWEGRGGHRYSVSSALYRSVRPKKRPSYVEYYRCLLARSVVRS